MSQRKYYRPMKRTITMKCAPDTSYDPVYGIVYYEDYGNFPSIVIDGLEDEVESIDEDDDVGDRVHEKQDNEA